jgi:glyoxylase I family protein
MRALPFHACEDTRLRGAAHRAALGVIIGLHAHRANAGKSFDECRTGLDHVSFGVASHDELAAWVARLDELGIEHPGIRDEREPFSYSTVVFRDPDNIQLELMWS